MKLSEKHIKSLRPLLNDLCGQEFTDEQVQEAGMAIMRFVIVKAQRRRELSINEENEYGQPDERTRAITQQ